MTDFSDPQSRQKFYQIAKKHGKSDEDILEYMSEKTQMQNAISLGFDESGGIMEGADAADRSGLVRAVQAGYIDPSDAIRKDPSVASYLIAAGFEQPQEDEKEGAQTVQLISQLKDLYYGGEGTRDDLAKGRVGGLLNRVARGVGAAPRAKTYKDYTEGVVSALKDLVGQTGQLTDQELDRMEGLLPRISDTKREAQMKWDQIDALLGAKYGKQAQPSGASKLGFQEEEAMFEEPAKPPQMNVSGDMAKAGDLVRGEDGNLKIHGDFEQMKEENFKLDKDGDILADNSVIRFLVDSRFLPIAGGLAAAPLTGGASLGATLAIGAGTAASGMALQRGLMELTDPDRAELGDHAKAILMEGITDAIFGGLTMGVFHVGGKIMLGLKEPMSEGAEAVAKEGMGELQEEGVEAAGRSLSGVETFKTVAKAGEEPAETISGKIGISSFRGNPVSSTKGLDWYYESMPGKKFAKSLQSKADDLNLNIKITKTGGMYEGTIEPSYQLAFKDAPKDDIRSLLAWHGKSAKQDSVGLFIPNKAGEGAEYLLKNFDDADDILESLSNKGIVGATYYPEKERIAVWDFDGGLRKTVNEIADKKKLNVNMTKGDVEFIADGQVIETIDKNNNIRKFIKGSYDDEIENYFGSAYQRESYLHPQSQSMGKEVGGEAREQGQKFISENARRALEGDPTLGEKVTRGYLKAVRHTTYLPKEARKNFHRNFGMHIEDAMVAMDAIPKNGKEAQKFALTFLGEGDAELHKLLDKQIVSTDKVLDYLKNFKKGYTKNEVLQPAAKEGITEVNRVMEYVKAHGDEMTGYELNEVKKQLQDLIKKDATGISQNLIKKGARDLRIMVEEMAPKELGGELSVRSANFKRALGANLLEVGENIDDDVFRFVFRFNDFIFGLVNPAFALGSKITELLGDTVLSEETLAKLIQKGLGVLSDRGARATTEAAKADIKLRMRNLLRFAHKQRIGFTVSKNLLKETAIQGTQPQEKQGMSAPEFATEEDINSPGFLLR